MLSLLSVVLTAVLRLDVEEIAPLKELLIWESEVLWPPSVVLTALLRLDVDERAPLREELICETDTERLRSGDPPGLAGPLGSNGSPI